jgi:endo-1,3(4)-beta-glucanase
MMHHHLHGRRDEDEKVEDFTPQPFPLIEETVASNPTRLWGHRIRRSPFPTNTPWLNFVLNDGNCHENFHPFLVKSEKGLLTICYPGKASQRAFIYQPFVADLSLRLQEGCETHVVSAFDDLSVTLDFGQRMTVPLVKGSPYITVICHYGTPVFSSIHAVLDFWSNSEKTKHRIKLNNGQVWVIYSSAPLELSRELAATAEFQGVLRMTTIPGDNRETESVLDRFSTCFPTGGTMEFLKPPQVKYTWKTAGWGELLMVCLPLHQGIMSHHYDNPLKTIPILQFHSLDGDLKGVLGDTWVLCASPIPVHWYSSTGIGDPDARAHLKETLKRDVAALNTITNPSTYFHGKALARAARLALIAEELQLVQTVYEVQEFLHKSLTPWFDGTFPGNAILYDQKWGGLISRNGARDIGADFGLGNYNDHHYHMGYFVYAGAVLAKLDPQWGQQYKPHLYALIGDYMSLNGSKFFPRLRCFDAFVLHSWAGGLVEFADGRNQESTSEAIHAYYAAALAGLAYKDRSLVDTGLTLAALESHSAQSLWHIPRGSVLYDPEFVEENRVVSVLWSTKRDSGLWFAGAERRDCRLGIQVLPITPVTEFIFTDKHFARELVNWAIPSLTRSDVTDGWRGFVYALQAIYEPREALSKILRLNEHDDGNSLSNLLWWIYTR